jgi:ABC-2 type transport system permease protein
MNARALSRLAALVRKEFRQLLRDASNLAIGIVLPIALILIFGYGLSLDVKHAPIAIVMEDPSPAAHDAVAGLLLSDAFAPMILASMHDAEALMRERKADAVVRVPVDYSRRAAAGDARIQLLLHGAA